MDTLGWRFVGIMEYPESEVDINRVVVIDLSKLADELVVIKVHSCTVDLLAKCSALVKVSVHKNTF